MAVVVNSVPPARLSVPPVKWKLASAPVRFKFWVVIEPPARLSVPVLDEICMRAATFSAPPASTVTVPRPPGGAAER